MVPSDDTWYSGELEEQVRIGMMLGRKQDDKWVNKESQGDDWQRLRCWVHLELEMVMSIDEQRSDSQKPLWNVLCMNRDKGWRMEEQTVGNVNNIKHMISSDIWSHGDESYLVKEIIKALNGLVLIQMRFLFVLSDSCPYKSIIWSHSWVYLLIFHIKAGSCQSKIPWKR